MKNFLRKFMVVAYILQIGGLPIRGETSAPDDSAVPKLLDVRAEGDQIVLEMSQLMPYKTTTLSSPWRLIVEIPGTLYQTGFSKKNLDTPLVRRVRGYQFKETPLISRVVLDLASAVDFKSDVSGSNIIITVKKNELAEQAANPTELEPKTEKQEKRVSLPKKVKDLLNSLPKEVVTLDFEGADIRDVIRLMAETSNINIIYGPEVAGTIAIHLKKVPFDEAFSTIMNLKGFVASQLGDNILRITTPDILQKEQAKAIVFTKSIPVNYLKADDMQKHIQSVMNSAGRKGTITVVQETNSVVVTDSQEGIAQAERLVGQLDKKPQQVMIEARLVEINLDNGLDIGVQWEFNRQNLSANRFTQIGAENPNGASGVKTTFANGTEIRPLGPSERGTGVSLPGPAAAGISFGLINNNTFLNVALNGLVTNKKAKILSSPKIVTINGQKAKIEAVQDIPFKTTTVSNGTPTESFTTVSAGIILSVTPTINAEDRITLQVTPESSLPTVNKFTGGNPVIQTRRAQTTVSIKDGETLVIGGLISDTDERTVEKVPILGDIPIIGVLFRHNLNSKIRNELLIFVTPRIIRE